MFINFIGVFVYNLFILVFVCFSWKITFYLFICACRYVCAIISQMWRSENNLWESVFSLYDVCPSDQIQVIRLGARTLDSEPK